LTILGFPVYNLFTFLGDRFDINREIKQLDRQQLELVVAGKLVTCSVALIFPDKHIF